MNGYKSPSGTTDNHDGDVNNLSALSIRRSALSQNRPFAILSALSQNRHFAILSALSQNRHFAILSA